MCLLIVAWQVDASFPLVVAANRDERLDRPARSLCVLSERGPRVLGGLDEVAGGTWLAVNEHGVVAGLTNSPRPGGPDPTRRSRGALPLLAASAATAEEGVERLLTEVGPGEYNACWLLVGDRDSLTAVEVPADGAATARALAPGLHVLENTPFGVPSPKVDRVTARVEAAGSGPSRWASLPSVLADHHVPPGVGPPLLEEPDDPGSADGEDGAPFQRRPETLAACVHTDDYGTRSAALIRVPADRSSPPEVIVADGPPCTAAFTDHTARWADGGPDPEDTEDTLRPAS